MITNRHSSSPPINSGSMADIAFLLLIFFLVCTTISSDIGLKRQLSKPCPPNVNCDLLVSENNLLNIQINEHDELMVRGDRLSIEQLKERVIMFMDNNANDECHYCKGKRTASDSDHPQKAKIALDVNPKSTYNFYIKVEDEISKAFKFLRISYAQTTFGKSIENLDSDELAKIRDAYPFNLADF